MLTGLLITVAAQHPPVLGLPPSVNIAAFIAVGWQVGGSFTRSDLRQFFRLLPLTCVFIGVMISGCLGLTLTVSRWIPLSFTQTYSVTTPSGIYAVSATASDSGAGSIVVTMQVCGVLVMYLVAIIETKLLTI